MASKRIPPPSSQQRMDDKLALALGAAGAPLGCARGSPRRRRPPRWGWRRASTAASSAAA
ncbi:hypothetical protein ACN28S_62190 [Cystobacter fuscus]